MRIELEEQEQPIAQQHTDALHTTKGEFTAVVLGLSVRLAQQTRHQDGDDGQDQ